MQKFNSYKLLLIGALLVLLSSAGYKFIPEYLTHKMIRHVHKSLGKNVSTRELALPDSIKIDHAVYGLADKDSLKGYLVISRALGCSIGGCEQPKSQNAFEQFYYGTVFNNEGKIKMVRVLEYTSDHGYQIANKGWLKQFEKADTFSVGANIDGISGATISVKSITHGVNKQTQIISQLKNEGLFFVAQ